MRSLPWLAAAFPQPRRGAKWTAAAKKTPSRVASCLQPLGVLVAWAASEISSEDSSRHAGAATSAFIMSGTVQLSEPQPAPCAKDSAMAARRAAASQIGDPACLYVFHRVSFDARMCNLFRSCTIAECVQKEIESDFTQPFSSSNHRESFSRPTFSTPGGGDLSSLRSQRPGVR